MQAVEQVRSLYAYNAWANSQVLDAAAALSEDERSSELGASFGSVEGNLWHLLSAQSVWLSRWTGAEFSPIPPPQGAGALDGLRHGFESSLTRKTHGPPRVLPARSRCPRYVKLDEPGFRL